MSGEIFLSGNHYRERVAFSPSADFAVWVLEQDGLLVPPFDKHQTKQGKLQALGMDASRWLSWFKHILDPANVRFSPVDYWKGSTFYEPIRRLHDRYSRQTRIHSEPFPLVYNLNAAQFAHDLPEGGRPGGELVAISDEDGEIRPCEPWTLYVSCLRYRTDERLRFDDLCAISERKPGTTDLVRRVCQVLGETQISGLPQSGIEILD